MLHRVCLQTGLEPIPGLRLIQLRGRGGFAEVWEASACPNRRIALKFISSDKTTSTVREMKSLQAIQRLEHPNLLKMEKIASIPGYIVVVMELAEGSLLELLDAYQMEYHRLIELPVLVRYMRQTADVLDFLNKRQHCFEGKTVGFQHCDIKPSNLLIQGDDIKLADFGLCTATTTPLTPYQRSGTLEFAPPEIHRGILSERSDQYSLAVSWYFMRTGELPFPPPPEVFRRHYSYSRPTPDLKRVDAAERAVLLRALDIHPERRWESCSIMMEYLCEALGSGGEATDTKVDEELAGSRH